MIAGLLLRIVELTQSEVKQMEPIFALDIGTRMVMGLVMIKREQRL